MKYFALTFLTLSIALMQCATISQSVDSTSASISGFVVSISNSISSTAKKATPSKNDRYRKDVRELTRLHLHSRGASTTQFLHDLNSLAQLNQVGAWENASETFQGMGQAFKLEGVSQKQVLEHATLFGASRKTEILNGYNSL